MRFTASIPRHMISVLALAWVALLAAAAAAEEAEVPQPVQSKVAVHFEQVAAATEPEMAWKATTTEEHRAWRERFGAKLKELLGRMPERVDLEVKWTEEKAFDTYTRHKVYVRSEGSYWVPVYYFVPHQLERQAPAIVCLHGHSGIYPYIREGQTEAERKKTAADSLDYAVYFAEHGYVTAAIVVRGWNETAGDQDRGVTRVERSCHQVTMNALLLGMTPQGLRCWDAMRVIDFLETQDEVDAQRIAVAGLSGGGTLATYLPVLDERVKLVMIGGAFSSYRTSIYAMPHCICNCLPGVMQYADMADVVALYAPRPVLLINGVKDPIFPIAEAREGFAKLRQVYRLLEAEERIDADFFDGPHAWSNNKTLAFLEEHFARSGGPVAPDAATDEAARRPNILFMFTDDQRFDTIAALGNREIHTPHADRLVERGFHFTNAYCMGSMVGAVCLPSRTMLITGRSLWRIPEKPRAKEAPPGVPLLPNLLREAGYATFHCGKIGNSCTFGNAAFDVNIETSGRTAESATENADHAIAFLKAHDGSRPFFMYLAPPVPHDPCLAPPEFLDRYDSAKLSLSKNFMPLHPFDNGEMKVRDELLAAHPRTPAEMRAHLAGYYGTITHLDHEFGRVLAEVERRGWMDNTVVIFSSDQGLAVGGRHGLMGKQNLYEHVKPPLVIAGPGIPQGRSDALVYLFDLFPTICELAGARTPEVVEGRSLVPVLHDPDFTLRAWLFGAYRDCQRMVRDRRWKLIRYNASGVRNAQLFDLQNDPDEIHNLFDDPKFAEERKRLEALLSQARRELGDPVDFDGGQTSATSSGKAGGSSKAGDRPAGTGARSR